MIDIGPTFYAVPFLPTSLPTRTPRPRPRPLSPRPPPCNFKVKVTGLEEFLYLSFM